MARPFTFFTLTNLLPVPFRPNIREIPLTAASLGLSKILLLQQETTGYLNQKRKVYLNQKQKVVWLFNMTLLLL